LSLDGQTFEEGQASMNGVALLRRVISQITVHYLDTRRDRDGLASAAVVLCERLLKTLSPLLGREGSLALFRRSLKLTEETFPCYSEARSAEGDGILNAVGTCLRRQKLEAAREATIALLLTFVELLATFIGERLTWQLLQEAWPEILTDPSQEKL
jgi:hypothetical protein